MVSWKTYGYLKVVLYPPKKTDYHHAKEEDAFNCIPLELTEDDLIQLGKEAKAYKLPQTEGFFFGADSSQDEDSNDVLEFVAKGLEALREGYEVAYSSGNHLFYLFIMTLSLDTLLEFAHSLATSLDKYTQTAPIDVNDSPDSQRAANEFVSSSENDYVMHDW